VVPRSVKGFYYRESRRHRRNKPSNDVVNMWASKARDTQSGRLRRRLVGVMAGACLYEANRFSIRTEHREAAEEDLVQEAAVAVLLAIDDYSAYRGNFRPFAYQRIKWALIGALPQFDAWRVNAEYRSEVLAVMRGKKTWEEISTHPFDSAQIYLYENIQHKVQSHMTKYRAYLALTGPVHLGDEGWESLPDEAAEDEPVDEAYTKIASTELRKAISTLRERERYVLLRRYGMPDFSTGYRSTPTTLAELSDELGVSPERVRQIQIEAERKLKKILDQEVGSGTLLGAPLACLR
jgi:RNA polymerase sigma factor (sigma-70 family)